MTLRATADNVLIKPLDARQHNGVIQLTDKYKNSTMPSRGHVVAVADSFKTRKGATVLSEIKVGDLVCWKKEHGQWARIGTERLIYLKQNQVRAVLHE